MQQFSHASKRFAETCPKTTPEAVPVATKPVQELVAELQKWLEHLIETRHEILDVNTAGTNCIDHLADVETD